MLAAVTHKQPAHNCQRVSARCRPMRKQGECCAVRRQRVLEAFVLWHRCSPHGRCLPLNKVTNYKHKKNNKENVILSLQEGPRLLITSLPIEPAVNTDRSCSTVLEKKKRVWNAKHRNKPLGGRRVANHPPKLYLRQQENILKRLKDKNRTLDLNLSMFCSIFMLNNGNEGDIKAGWR